MLWASYDKRKEGNDRLERNLAGRKEKESIRRKGKDRLGDQEGRKVIYASLNEGKTYEAGSMWDGKKSKEREKANQRRYKYENAPGPVSCFTVYSCVVKK